VGNASSILTASLIAYSTPVGNDIRRVVEDGWPIQYTVGSDLRQGELSSPCSPCVVPFLTKLSALPHEEFWDLGHELFNSTPKSCPITFVAGDIFSNSILDLSTPPLSRRPALNQALASLTPLKNHISVIHTSAFFHLFGETAQRELAHRLGVLLSSNPGSIIFGSQIGAMDNQEYKEVTPQGREKYRHSPQSWTRLWDEVFGVGNCQVDTYNIPEEVRDSQNGMKAMDDWAPGLVHHTKLVWMVRRI
jgi:hypothetical protein